jgi:ABC-type transport system substrate-binding protein
VTRFVVAAVLAAAWLSAQGADPGKVLRFAFQNAEATFDPAMYQDLYSGMVLDQIIDPMITYDHLSRPAKLIPNTLESMPEVSADGMTYTFRVRKGIYFTPDAASRASGGSWSPPTTPSPSCGSSTRR